MNPTSAPDLPTAVVASVPAKLILMGEHAVVYGRPALVAAFGLRLRAQARRVGARAPPEDSGVDIDLPAIGYRARSSWLELREHAAARLALWQGYDAEPTPARFALLRDDDRSSPVRLALGVVASSATSLLRARRLPELRLRIDSEIPVGSGFGSSAATAVAVCSAVGVVLAVPASPGDLEGLASTVERCQHGRPSGVDAATVMHGGVLWARRSADGELERRVVQVSISALRSLQVFHTGPPGEDTGSVVADVRARRDRDPDGFDALLDTMEEATRGFLRAIAIEPSTTNSDSQLRYDVMRESVRSYQSCLENLGVVPTAVRQLVRRIEAGGSAAKISGAGSLAGPGAGSLLVLGPEIPHRRETQTLAPSPPISDAAAETEAEIATRSAGLPGLGYLDGLRAFDAPLGVDGLRIEVTP